MDEASMSERRFMAEARRAYEGGRMRWALRLALPTLLLGALALTGGTSYLEIAVWTAALFVYTGGLGWARGVLGRGALIGSVVGAVPLLVATVTHEGHVCHGAVCFQVCLALALVGGLGCGALMAFGAGREAHPLRFYAAAFGAAALATTLGCQAVGVGSVVGLGVGLLLSAVPAVVFSRARA